MRRNVNTLAALCGATLALGTPAMSSGSHGSGTVSAGTHIVITVTGRGVDGDTTGTFTLKAARAAASGSGTIHLGGNISGPPPQPVPGYLGWRGTAEGHGELVDGKQGGLWLSWSGSFITVNASSVYTGVMSGAWRITRGTGIYKNWKGTGRFVSTERHAPSPSDRPSGVGPYEARFVGLVTR